MAKRNTSPARGMRDLLPAAVRLRHRCEAIIRERYGRHGFDAIETPAVEHLELLSSGEGGENEKLIYKVLKRGSKLESALARVDPADPTTVGELSDLGLRYDLTVPLARFYAQNQGQLPTPFKSLQIGPVWRAERPQKGRYRQFTQCDIDVLGEAGVDAEIELVAATTDTLSALGLADFVVRLNDRRLLSELVRGAGFAAGHEGSVLIALDKLDKIGSSGVTEELVAAGHPAASVASLLAVLDDGADGLTRLAERSPAAAEALGGLRRILDAFAGGVPGGGRLELDPTLVRGMGYYTGPIFEVGLQGVGFSVAGGGRYDDMVSGLIGRPLPACGFSIGFERVVLVLEERGQGASADGLRIALLHDGRDPAATLSAAATLRAEHQAPVSTVKARKKQGPQLDELSRHGFTHVARLGSDGSTELRPLGPG